MVAYIHNPDMPFAFRVDDAGLDEVADTLSRWMKGGHVQVFELGDIARYVVNFGRWDLFAVTVSDPSEEYDDEGDAPVIMPINLREHERNT